MALRHVESNRHGPVTILRISNPPDGYLTDKMVEELDKAFRSTEDTECKVVVITGGLPGIFVQHYDLSELHAIGERLRDRGGRHGERKHVPERRIDLLFRRLEESNKIVIAAINGNAMGGGLEMALACDFRILQKGDYLLGLPEIHVGQLPGAGGTQRLTRLIGVAGALDLMLHGRRLSPTEAMQAGLAHEVADDALAAAMRRAEQLATLNGDSLGYIKRLVYSADNRWLYDGLDVERRLFVDLLSSEEGLRRLGSVCHAGQDFRSLQF